MLLLDAVLPPPLDTYEPLIVGAVKAVTILFLGWVVAKWIAALALRAFRKRNMDEAVSRFLGSLVQYAVLAAAVIAALGTVGIETTSLVAILGSAALAVGLALQGSLSNFAAGVMVLLFRPFAIGDVVTVAGHTGTVDDIGLFATTLITPDNHRVVVPNAAVTGGSIVNLTVLGTRRGEVDVGVAYGCDPTKVMAILTTAAASVEGCLQDPAPAALVFGFGASSVDFKLRVWAKCADWGGVVAQTRIAVYEALNAAGIEIPFEQVVVHKADAA